MSKLFKAVNNQTKTTNAMDAHRSTLSGVLDFYSRAGSMRGMHRKAIELFWGAYNEDATLAVKALFWLRDIPGRGQGAGERDLFRAIFKEFAAHQPRHAASLAAHIPTYGRWDDLFEIAYSDKVGAEFSGAVFDFIERQYEQDLDSEFPSLLAKWMPSENASSKVSKHRARHLMVVLGLSARQYRKNLSMLRTRLGVIEQMMSAGEWEGIDFSKVPSQAMRIHGREGKAFRNHMPIRFQRYLDSVQRGEKDIKAGTLNPYQLVKPYMAYGSRKDDTIEAQWKALPDYIQGTPGILPVVDVSGSMTCRITSDLNCMTVSVALGLYIAERVGGAFKNQFITFSTTPSFDTLKGTTLHQKVNNMKRAHWGGSTDLMKTFDLVLDAARRYKLAQEDMPKAVVILSDMQFNRGVRSGTSYQLIRKNFRAFGYEAPMLVYWNLHGGYNNVQVTEMEPGAMTISGFSSAPFMAILKGDFDNLTVTPYDAMMATLMGERYEIIV